MAYDMKKAFTDPDFDRSEWRMYITHPKMPGAGSIAHYVGVGVESMEYAIATESVEKRAIDQRLPTVTNKDGGITAPAAFELTKGQAAYDAILSAGLLGKVNEEFTGLFVYGNIGVKQSGVMLDEAPFTTMAKVKVTVSSAGGAGTEKISVTSEIKTTGDIERGYAKIEDGGTLNYDPDKGTWKVSAFVPVPGLDIGDLIIGAASAE